jgi:glycosyltransferase involved in cell wall biosynthesis
MRINLISNHRKDTGLHHDVSIMRGILTSLFEDKVQIQLVQYVQPHCVEADINIFFEVINPSLFSYAERNIWIPNHECTYQTWIPYMHMVNEIWTKTREAERIFSALTPTLVRYIGWTSLSKEYSSKKNYFKAFVPLGKNYNREVDVIFNAYLYIKKIAPVDFSRLPVLHIVSWIPLDVPEGLSDVVKVYNALPQEEYDNLLKECGLCICLSKAEGFGHAVNESMSSGCNLILSSIAPFLEDIAGEANDGVTFVAARKTVPNDRCFGNLVSSDVYSLAKSLQSYNDMSMTEHKSGSNFMRTVYEGNHAKFLEHIKVLFIQTFHINTPYSLQNSMPKESDLPNVSIVCVTRDRRMFMPILKYSYMIQSYPEEKLELIVVDDGDDPIEDTLIGVPNVVYVKLDDKKTIGEKRNIGVSKAMYDVIAFMDDDDIYPNNSILERTAMMLKFNSKECAFCTVLPCYDICKYSSFMNAPPLQLAMAERVSEATLIFTRKFWEERNFGNTQIAEGYAFIRGREHMCRELSPQEVIVSLTHSNNTSSRKIPEFKEPNGCHFGFNEKLFEMVSEIGEFLKTKHTSEGSLA